MTRRIMLSTAAMAVTSLVGAAGASAAPQGEDPLALERVSLPSCPARDVRVDSGDSARLSLSCKGLDDAKARIVTGPQNGQLGKVYQGSDRVKYRPDDGFRGPDRVTYERRSGGHVFRAAVHVAVGGASSAPRCGDQRAIARSESRVQIRMRCRGEGLRKLKVGTAGVAGEVENVRQDSANGGDTRTITASYTPPEDFSGQESVTFGATNSPGCSEASIWCGHPGSTIGAIDISVLPWRMRAIGDSVTAGFGFYGDGTAMSEGDLVACEPSSPPNNRCSSNSDEKGNYSGDASWSSDYGLQKNISWAAQFANSIAPNGQKVTAPDVFQNLAVTGSAPSDWLPNGSLDSELEGVIAENPELIAMTMGANPLLSDLLESETYEFSCSPKTTVADLIECIDPAFVQVQLQQRLQQLYTAILNGAPNSTVVTFHYHLADPSLTLFSNWQAEAMIDYMNDQISDAVAATRRALPEEASRLILIEGQRAPGSAAADQVPRFNIGLPPVSQQTWAPTHPCSNDSVVDGPSHQSASTQQELANDSSAFCPGDPWIISADTGIHPNAEGYSQFATALGNVAQANDLVPTAD